MSAHPETPTSVHTSNLPGLLAQTRTSVLVSTYQAGKVILLRNDEGTLNTHFRALEKPMGVAVHGERLAVGGPHMIWHYRNVPALARISEPAGKHDACFVHRRTDITGDADVHELAFDGTGALWFVNTRFSCLCTLDDEHSFVPRWRPPFVTAYAADDRCHLNGVAMVDGRPRYVTAFGATDSPREWRAHKRDGGILYDLERRAIVAGELAMPHSPRVYGGKLYVLESGVGGLVEIDPASGAHRTLALLPGFTRGLDFLGPLAVIGLSQVRESAVFGEIPLLERVDAPKSGVWFVHLETGQVVAFVEFEAGVREIFAVQVLVRRSFPEFLDREDPLVAQTYVLPDAALAEVAAG